VAIMLVRFGAPTRRDRNYLQIDSQRTYRFGVYPGCGQVALLADEFRTWSDNLARGLAVTTVFNLHIFLLEGTNHALFANPSRRNKRCDVGDQLFFVPIAAVTVWMGDGLKSMPTTPTLPALPTTISLPRALSLNC